MVFGVVQPAKARRQATLLSARNMQTDGPVVVPVKVVELCFTDASAAPKVSARIIDEHPTSVVKILTESDLRSKTSVLHVHVLADRIDEFLGQQAYIKGSGGVMLITVPPGTN